MSNHLSELYKIKRFQPEIFEEKWPPDQPKTIINLAFINFEEKQTQRSFMEMSTHRVSALCSQNPRVTKDIREIFRSSKERCILVEGAPGIGKTVLSKEIAYRWANRELLGGMKLFLLFIRDPALHSVESVDDLVNYLGKNRLSSSDIEAAADKLKEINGFNLVFVIDGYDECPQNSALKRFINKLYMGEFLSQCRVLITSRPTASLSLCQLPCQRIEILGLAKEEQDQYISESLEKSPSMETRLQEYLRHQPIINSLIYVPLNLSILLYLFKQNILPETLTEMNEYFIKHTIYRHLTKVRKDLNNNINFKLDKITDLPDTELAIVKQLSKLAYKGLCEHRLIFTDDEIKEMCPKINDIPDAINGLSLLQVKKSYYQEGPGISASFNFLHLTMQEYLAALYVSTLPIEQQSRLMRLRFFDNHFNFMWVMYTGITQSQDSQPSCFTDIVSSILSDNKVDKCAILFIFQCYLERKDLNTIPNAIASMFSDGNIDLSGIPLLPHHVLSLIIFMMKSPTKWKSLNLQHCFIGYKGVSTLTTFFSDFSKELSTIKYVNLSLNGLTSLWEAHTNMHNEADTTAVTESALLSVQSLDLSWNFFNDNGTKKLFFTLKLNKSLIKLKFSQNNVTVDTTVAVSECLKVNTTLQDLDISINNITDEGAKRLAEALQENSTLHVLNISKTFITKEGVMNIIEACTNNMCRELNKLSLVCTHNYLSKTELAVINNYVKEQNAVQIVDSSWNYIATKDGRLVIKTMLNVQQKPQTDNSSNIGAWEEVQDINRYLHRTFLQSCFEEYLNQQSVDLQDIHLDNFKIEVLSEGLKLNNTVTELNLSKSKTQHMNNINFLHKINDDDVYFISNSLKVNTALCKLNLSGNEITDSGIKTLAESLTDNVGLQVLDLSKNNISDEGAKRLGECIEKNVTLLELDISKNWISKEGVMRIVNACTKNITLHKLVCTHNNLSESGLITITKFIREETEIQVFHASWNSICSNQGIFAIESTIQLLNLQQAKQSNVNYQKEKWNLNEISNLEHRKKFLLSCFEDKQSIVLQGIEHRCFESKQNVNEQDQYHSGMFDFRPFKRTVNKTESLTVTNNLTSEIGIICDCIKMHKTLSEFTLSNYKITSKEVQIVAKTIETHVTLQSLDISCDNISDEGVLFIRDCLEVNQTLCKLNLSGNQITQKGVETLAKAITVNKALQTLDISCNVVSDDGISFLSVCLKNNEKLKELNLSGNKITDEGTKKLAEAIQVNTTLQTLNISKNLISKEGIRRILKACKKRRTLQKLIMYP